MPGLTDIWNERSTRAKIIGGAAGAVASIFAAITAFIPAVEAWDKAGLPTLSTRGFVREQTFEIKSSQAIDKQQMQSTQALEKAQLQAIQLDNANGKRENLTAARNKLELDALQYDDAGKIKAQQEMRRLDESINAISEQIRSLNGQRSPN